MFAGFWEEIRRQDSGWPLLGERVGDSESNGGIAKVVRWIFLRARHVPVIFAGYPFSVHTRRRS